MGEKVDRLILAAQKLAEQQPDFFKTKGQGPGDHAANEYMRNLRKVAQGIFGKDHSEAKVRADLDFKFDFYFPEEATVVEIALSLDKPMTEMEKDIFKCLLAKEAGKPIERLVLVAKPGGETRQTTPGQAAIREFVTKKFGLGIDIFELVREEL